MTQKQWNRLYKTNPDGYCILTRQVEQKQMVGKALDRVKDICKVDLSEEQESHLKIVFNALYSIAYNSGIEAGVLCPEKYKPINMKVPDDYGIGSRSKKLRGKLQS